MTQSVPRFQLRFSSVTWNHSQQEQVTLIRNVTLLSLFRVGKVIHREGENPMFIIMAYFKEIIFWFNFESDMKLI